MIYVPCNLCSWPSVTIIIWCFCFFCMLGNFLSFCCRLQTYFQNKLFQKILSGALSGWQTVLIQIRTDILSVLIWVQTVCKGYQQTTKVATSKERFHIIHPIIFHTFLFTKYDLCHNYLNSQPASGDLSSVNTFTMWTQIWPKTLSDLIWI